MSEEKKFRSKQEKKAQVNKGRKSKNSYLGGHDNLSYELPSGAFDLDKSKVSTEPEEEIQIKKSVKMEVNTDEVEEEQFDPSSSQKKTEQDSSSKDNHYEKSTDSQDDISTNWFLILEVSETAPLAEISASYKRIIRQYHPDKVASLGKELRELAEIKSKQINSAYQFAQKIRNF